MKLTKLIAFISAIFISSGVYAQLAVFQDEEDVITPTFRYDIIKLNKVKSITIQYEYKPDGAAIIDDGNIKYFRFDSLYRLVESYYTVRETRDSWDTIRSLYYYDDFGHLIIKRTNEGNFYDTWYYRWYGNGDMKKRAHVHEVPLNTDNSTGFRIGTQTILSADSFAYAPYPKQVQRYGYNEENKIYEKTISYFDDKHRLISRNFHYEVGWLYSQVDLKYDAQNRVVEYGFTGNLNGDVHHSVTITYDATGGIASEKLFNKDKQADNIEYMYDNNTGLITNQLDRDLTKLVINIARFSYEYR
ncbi:MAG TPA: hypothetical protein VN922_10095 [Bacteroidia bacterium]|nr:hypothetical protein [Bacteroidia bacterium]